MATRAQEHCVGKPIPTEVSLHNHAPSKDDFSVVYRTKFTKIAESLVLNTIPRQQLLNEMGASFQLKLFDYFDPLRPITNGGN